MINAQLSYEPFDHPCITFRHLGLSGEKRTGKQGKTRGRPKQPKELKVKVQGETTERKEKGNKKAVWLDL